MGATDRSTVPVTCPHCRHEGPAYVYLLGKVSRCKKCRQTFAMPRNVRIACPHCRAMLRVPGELLGQDVACKFCDAMFHANPARAEGRRPVPANARPAVAPSSFEHDLVRVLGEHEELRDQLGRVQQEIDELNRRERQEMQEIRSQVDRLAAVRAAFARAADRPDPAGRPAKPHAAPPAPAIARHPAPPGGHGPARVAAAPPGRGYRGAVAAKPRAAAGDPALRNVIERLASCEAMTDRLINRLRSAQERRAEDRATFARVIDRLHEELTRARDQFVSNRVDSDSTTERDDGEDGKLDPISMNPRLPDCGVA